MRLWGLMPAVVLGLVVVAKAEPLEPKQVPADATWVVHLDVDAMRASAVLQEAYHRCMEKRKDVIERHLATVRQDLGMDPRKDLHSVTLFGPKLGDLNGVMIVRAEMDRQRAAEKVKKAPDYKSSTYGAYELASWTHKGKGRQHAVTAAFWKPAVMVFGPSPETVQNALDVLDGKRPALGGKDSLLAAGAPNGAFLIVRAIALADAKLPWKSPLVKQSDALSLALGESQGESFVSGKVVMKSPETVGLLRQVMEGGRALAKLRHTGDAEALKLIDRLKVTSSGNALDVEFRAPAADVSAHLQKAVAAGVWAHGHLHQHAKTGDAK